MGYKVTLNSKSYDLPKCTISIEERVELMRDTEKEVGKGTERKRVLVEQMLAFVEMCLGEDNAKEALEYTNIENVDTKDLEMVCSKIMNAYSEKATKEKVQELKRLTADINGALNTANLKALFDMSAKK